jgi:asparagine N-glycosylation enzyme membrane subunit Stt3
MAYCERKLALAQQKLASLLLELTTESIDRLDSSVKTLDSSVGSLSNLTRRVVKSSKALEYLTSVIIVVAIIPISLSLLSWNPYYGLISVIAAFMGLVVIWRRARKELPKI